MRGSILTGAVLALSWLVCLSLAETAMAQFGPYGYYSGGWGANAYAATARSTDVSRQLASQRHAKSFARGQQQVTNLQREIRGTLTSEAQRRTASMGQYKSDYMETEKFLDALAAESQGRIDRRTAKEPAVEPSEKPAASGSGGK